jgi:hypothetical protein
MPEHEAQFFFPNNTLQKFGVSTSAAGVRNMNKEKQEEQLQCSLPNQGM